MALQIGDALRSGFDTLLSEDGLLVTGVFLLFNLGNTVANSSFTEALFDEVLDMGGPAGPGGSAGAGAPGFSVSDFTGPFSLDIAVPVAVVMVLLFLVVGQLVKFWGIRLFAEPQEIMEHSTSDRAVMAVVLGGGVAVLTFAASMSSTALNASGRPLLGGLAGLLGGLLSLIVGLAFVYLLQSIALYDGGYVATLKHCVARFMDAPAQIIVILFLLLLLGIIPGIPSTASVISVFLPGSFDLPSQSVLQVASMVLNAPVQAFSLAVITDAYLQVRADRDDDGF
ncbi:hypothetical protein [Haloarcula rubripromontorii]|uniref:Uncharacterized protein n=1 Tax=Haloarcula rubripromontorii TaxID=1705562 RepID=A0A0M9ANZ2_9EURY|nr:hypothetical protein [Haloarcula rubripromontorii]KOX94531.1 hypothetical protein AMS69_01325 [Haloarcula rubripromontorii]NLV07477.1 hypothetical protein [Haloarcula rubripromontorii]